MPIEHISNDNTYLKSTGLEALAHNVLHLLGKKLIIHDIQAFAKSFGYETMADFFWCSNILIGRLHHPGSARHT